MDRYRIRLVTIAVLGLGCQSGCKKDAPPKQKVDTKVTEARAIDAGALVPLQRSDARAPKAKAFPYRIGKVQTRYFWKETRFAARVEVENTSKQRRRLQLCVTLLDSNGDTIVDISRHGVNPARGEVAMVEKNHRVDPKLWRSTTALRLQMTRYNCPGTEKHQLSEVVRTTPQGKRIAEVGPDATKVSWPFVVEAASATYDDAKLEAAVNMTVRAEARAEGFGCVVFYDKDDFKLGNVRLGRISLEAGARQTYSRTRLLSRQVWRSAAKTRAYVAGGSGCADFGRPISEAVDVTRR